MTDKDKDLKNLLAELERMPEEEARSRAGTDDREAPREEFMRKAIEIAERGRLAGEPPVGACIVRQGQVLACLHNAVVSEMDVTAHAEVRVLREACRLLKALDLSGCEIYSTVEPCAMCMSACYYAHVSRVVYGARLSDIGAETGDELSLRPQDLIQGQDREIEIVGDFMRDTCLDLLKSWSATGSGAALERP